jgi:hypothetical protein
LADITFSNVSADTKAELNAIAVANGFLNVKRMTKAYWKACILSARQKAIMDTIPQANTDDVVIDD